MKGLGTILNIVTVLIGGSLGLLIGNRLQKNIHEAVISVTGFISLVMGMQMALQTKNILIVLISLMIGIVIGELVDIDGKLVRLSEMVEKKFSKGEKGNFARAFLTSSIVFCVGPLTIIGSLKDGLSGDYSLLSFKAILDGFTAIAFAAALGTGVLFTSFTILIVQGGLTVFASFFSGFLTEAAIAELSGVGGVMILSIGLNILGVKKFKTANMLPALCIAPILVIISKNILGFV